MPSQLPTCSRASSATAIARRGRLARTASTAARPPSGSRPARSRSARSPTSVSQQPIEPQRAGEPVGLSGHVPHLAAVAGRAGRACGRRSMTPPPTPTSPGDVEHVVGSAARPAAMLGQRAEVGLVGDGDAARPARAPRPGRSARGTSRQPRLGACRTMPVRLRGRCPPRRRRRRRTPGFGAAARPAAGERGQVRDGLVDRQVAARAVHAHQLVDGATQADDAPRRASRR